MERLLEPLSFAAADHDGKSRQVHIDARYVDSHLGELAEDADLSRYVL